MKKITLIVLVVLTGLGFVNSQLAQDPTGKLSLGKIDEYALKARPIDELSVLSLAQYLSAGARTDTEKARAAYRWITAKIAYDNQMGETFESSLVAPETVLKRRRTVCSGYANLYRDLAQAMGLRAEVVGGINWLKKDHAWNAVMIDGSWRLLDATFGAGGRVEQNFLTPPQQFLFDHFPNGNEWQLLRPPWTKDEWLHNVRPHEAFFNSGFSMASLSEKRGTLYVTTESTIIMKGPPGLTLDARFFEVKGNQEVPIENAAMLERDNDVYTIHFSPPHKGSFSLRINNLADSQWLAWYTVEMQTSPTDWAGFPSFLPSFYTVGGTLLSPRRGLLPRNTELEFAIRLPGLQRVSVATTGLRVPMVKDPDGTFRARLRTPNQAATLEIQEQPPGVDWFSRIVVYRVE